MKEIELIQLLREFSPHEFTEDNYVNSPLLMIIEKADGQDLIVVARSQKSIHVLDRLSSSNHVKKLREDVYSIERLSMIDAMVKFSWIIRLSWKNEDAHLVWSLLNSYLKSSDQESLRSILLKEFNIELEKCLRKLSINTVEDYSEFLGTLLLKLDQTLSNIPPILFQKIIDYLCIHGELTVEELSRKIVREGISISTLYKTLSKLKKDNYVRVVKHIRVSNRGPMRELLTSNCNKCLYNHSSHDACYKFNLNQLSAVLYALYDKLLTQKDMERLYIEFRSIPYPQRVLKRINNILISLHSIKSRLDDKLTNSILQRIQSITGAYII